MAGVFWTFWRDYSRVCDRTIVNILTGQLWMIMAELLWTLWKDYCGWLWKGCFDGRITIDDYSCIHYMNLYSASSRLLLRSAPDFSMANNSSFKEDYRRITMDDYDRTPMDDYDGTTMELRNDYYGWSIDHGRITMDDHGRITMDDFDRTNMDICGCYGRINWALAFGDFRWKRQRDVMNTGQLVSVMAITIDQVQQLLHLIRLLSISSHKGVLTMTVIQMLYFPYSDSILCSWFMVSVLLK